MKIRNGFVSNSSSASYIVRVKSLTYDEFLNGFVREHEWSFFNKEAILKYLKDRLEEGLKDIAELDSNEAKPAFKELFQNRVDDTKELIEQMEKCATMEEIVKEVLVTSGVRVHTDSLSDDILVFESGTIMHNSLSDMNPLAKEIALYYLFSGKRVSGEWRDESN